MAAAKPEGILAILAGGKKGGASEESDDGEPSTVKARAVRDMFRAGQKEDWDAASEAFHRAYVECSKKAEESDEEPEEGPESSDYEDEE